LKKLLKIDTSRLDDYKVSIENLIRRVIDDKHDISDFIIVLKPDFNDKELDSFEVITINKN
jgi:hypothetical protein